MLKLAEVIKMIEFRTKEEFLSVGLGFTDYFEEMVFDMCILKDGFMMYDPVTMYMYDTNHIKMFFVEQKYRPVGAI